MKFEFQTVYLISTVEEGEGSTSGSNAITTAAEHPQLNAIFQCLSSQICNGYGAQKY